MTAKQLPRGISRNAKGFRLSIRVRGKLWQRQFHRDTPLDVLEDELRAQRKKLHRTPLDATVPGSFADDVQRYLTDYFTGRSAREERARHLQLWVDSFGLQTWRRHITKDDVSRILQRWRADGLAPDTCNKRRTALLALFNALDGKGAENPVRDVPKFRTDPLRSRALDYRRVAKALKKLPRCRTRARLKLIAYTGARPTQVMQITPEDWDDKTNTLILRATKKGAGTKTHTIPLSPEAQAAMREFDNTDAYGRFTLAPMGRMWKAVAVKAGLPADVRVYDLRHAFGTAVYAATGDIRATSELMGHASLAMTTRYTLAAVPARQQVAIAAFSRALQRRKRKQKRRP